MSQPGRVTSKNLFTNLQLTGQYDPEVLQELMDKNKPANMQSIMEKMEKVIKTEDDGTLVASTLREISNAMLDPMNAIPFFAGQMALCHQEQLTVPATATNSAEVKVLVHRPKKLTGASPAIVYVHGGGAVAGTASQFAGHCSHMAECGGVVVFNVDYRLAPEAKCPENILDFYSVLKYVLDNSAALSVDPARVAVWGESGGGYLTAGLCVMLAQNDESHLVKLAVPSIPMLDDYCWSDPASMTKEEGAMPGLQKKVWNAIATDLEAQRASADPLLFPGKAADDLLAKFPPTVIYEVEFDFYITEATRFARRLKAAGRLLELVVVPGLGHGHAMDKPEFKKFKEQRDIVKTIIQEYLVN